MLKDNALERKILQIAMRGEATRGGDGFVWVGADMQTLTYMVMGDITDDCPQLMSLRDTLCDTLSDVGQEHYIVIFESGMHVCRVEKTRAVSMAVEPVPM